MNTRPIILLLMMCCIFITSPAHGAIDYSALVCDKIALVNSQETMSTGSG